MKLDTHVRNCESRHIQAQLGAYFRSRPFINGRSDINQYELALKMGISLSVSNYFIRALNCKGFVEPEDFQSSKSIFKDANFLISGGIAEKMSIADRFLQLKLREYETLQAETKGLNNNYPSKFKITLLNKVTPIFAPIFPNL
jgi:hypothetical protein